MPWIKEDMPCYQRFCIQILKCGPIPQHIGFIADGNRRFARELNLSLPEGHRRGFVKLIEVLNWCRALGTLEITAYLMSPENLQRPKEEADALIQIFEDFIQQVYTEKDTFREAGVRVRVFGNLELFPPSLLQIIAKAIEFTKDNDKFYINLAMPYSSRREITQAMKAVVYGVRTGSLEVADIDEGLLNNCMVSDEISDPELVIRTSGENRLSDFLLWKMSATKIDFVTQMWPRYSIWSLFTSVFLYQHCYKQLPPKNRKVCLNNINPRTEKFLKLLFIKKDAFIQHYVSND